jgi:predicted MFS family arabinose efflux permease
MKSRTFILFIIVFAQFCCTSLWFATNAIINELILQYGLQESALGELTSAVQFGFIIGTLFFGVLAIADKFSPSKVFLLSAVGAALINALIIYKGNNLVSLLTIRFIVGVFLAGIYPVGMKIAADYYKEGLGVSLGYLVGALVMGTALPHALKAFGGALQWETGIITISCIAIAGGFCIYFFVPDGPYRKKGSGWKMKNVTSLFKNRAFVTAAVGYFGHMWELYAFWAFVPIVINLTFDSAYNHSLLSFLVIAVGALGCITGGYLSKRYGVQRVAFLFLFISFCCCLLSPFILNIGGETIVLIFLLIWGFTVVADSPLFSTAVAISAPAEIKGSALTIVTCFGFFISIVSIQLLNYIREAIDIEQLFIYLCIGPAIGLGIYLINRKRILT